MVDTDYLEKLIKNKGLKKGKIKDTLGISYYWLRKKIHNETSFKAEEITQICNLLEIKDLSLKEKIFFKNDVE